MLNTFQSILLMAVTMGCSIAFLLLVHRFWPPEQRRQHNDLIGWQITVLGTTYAVVLGLMLYAVWTNFELADGNAEAEANCLVNVVRSAQGLATADKQAIQDFAVQYVDIMLTEEWPAMSRVTVSPASDRCIQKTLGSCNKSANS